MHERTPLHAHPPSPAVTPSTGSRDGGLAQRLKLGAVAGLTIASLAVMGLGCDTEYGPLEGAADMDPAPELHERQIAGPATAFTVEILFTTNSGLVTPIYTVYNTVTGAIVYEGVGVIPAQVAAATGIPEITLVEGAAGTTVTATSASGGVASTLITATGVVVVVVGGAFLIYEAWELNEHTQEMSEMLEEGVLPPPGSLNCAMINIFSGDYWQCFADYWGGSDSGGSFMLSEPTSTGQQCCCDLRTVPHGFEHKFVFASEGLCADVGGEHLPGTCGSLLPTGPGGQPIAADDREAQHTACISGCVDICMQDENATFHTCQAWCDV